MQFKDVIAQDEVKALLRRQLAEGQVPHAQLFCGPEGCGKLAMAVAYASLLLCESPTAEGEPCGHCAGCRMTRSLAHPDLHFVFPVFKPKGQSSAATSDLFLAQWREQLLDTPYFDHATWAQRIGIENQQTLISAAESELIVQKLGLVSSQGGYKVMIVWLPERMNEAAANKLLKELEEPPQQTVFLLVSDHPERLLATIVSRTRRMEFKSIPQADMQQALCQRNGLSQEDAAHVAHTANGSYINALKLLHRDDDEHLFFDMFVLLMRKCYMRDIKEMYAWAEQVASWGRERQKHFLEYTQRLVRENFMRNFNLPELNYMNQQEADFSVRFSPYINERNVIGIMDELSDAQRDIEQNVNARMVFTDFSLKMIVLLIQ